MKSSKFGKPWALARSKHFLAFENEPRTDLPKARTDCRAGASPALTTSAEDEQLNGFGQLLSNVCGNATAKELHQRRTLRGTDNEEIHAHGCGKINNCRGGVLTYGVKRNHVDVALAPEFPHRA